MRALEELSLCESVSLDPPTPVHHAAIASRPARSPSGARIDIRLSAGGASLAPDALEQLVAGLSGGGGGGGGDDRELRLDLRGALGSLLGSAHPHHHAAAGGAAAVGETLAKLVEAAPCVAGLDVGDAPLGPLGAGPLARALARSASLTQLSLATTGLGPSMDGAKKLATALRQNGDLLQLDLRHNGLSPEALRMLRAAAAVRPRSAAGDQEDLELMLEPQAPPLSA